MKKFKIKTLELNDQIVVADKMVIGDTGSIIEFYTGSRIVAVFNLGRVVFAIEIFEA